MTMVSSFSLPVAAFILVLLQQQSHSAKQSKECFPSSCGEIHHISYPFRLKGDTRGCGVPRYELDCTNNNVTVLNLFSGKYHVKEINYERYKIRLVDAGMVEEDNRTSRSIIPHNFLIPDMFSGVTSYPGSYQIDPLTYMITPGTGTIPANVLFLNCTGLVTGDPRYVEVNPGHGDSQGYIYAVLNNYLADFRLMDIKVGCEIEASTFVERTKDRNVSYGDVKRLVENGFWLSWLIPVICEDKCGKGAGCLTNETTEQVIGCGAGCNFMGYQTTTCGTPSKIFRFLRGYIIRDIIIGFYERITNIKQPLLGWSQTTEGEFIGLNVLPILVAARYLFGSIVLLVIFIYMWRRSYFSRYENIEFFLQDNDLNPIRYEYGEIKKMTKNFEVKLGEGGFGSVYKAKLRSGLDVAVKVLSKSKTRGQDFINEVATIGRIHHMNVVRLIGYCVQREKCALVYEYMPNGSLDKHIFSKGDSTPLTYEKTYEISLGIARGIAYLHQDCDVQILHFDIKPHNILLDDNFTPKVSDFGLAKLFPIKDKSIVLTAARGTLGYMAPELFYQNIGGVSYKADVYSFGMLLMEMGSRRKNSNPNAEHSSQSYFPFWIYDQFKEVKDIDMGELVSEDDKILVKKMFIVALWCIQLKPNDRPSMKKVVEMLEGKFESLEMPPKPDFCPHGIIEPDVELNSNQTSWSDSTSNKNLGKTKSNHSLDNNV